MLIVVAALITQNDKFLIAQRSKGELEGLWEFPGGKVEVNESKKEAIIREIKEEFDTEIGVINKVAVFDYTYSFANIQLTLFHCELKSSIDDLVIQDSHKKIAWVDYSESILELAQLDKEIFDYLKENYVI